MCVVTPNMQSHRQLIERIVAKGGPEPLDYPQLDDWAFRVHSEVATGAISRADLVDLRAAFGDAVSVATIQGFALHKPHGYAGDFEIIDRIYREHRAEEPHLARWDQYCNQHNAAKAVRNRKAYFHQTLDRHRARRADLRVLNIASGPGRCMFEWLAANPAAQTSFHCIEIDPNAIVHASRLNEPFIDRITFTQMNALKFNPAEKFDLVWASGIFDYFADDVFQSLLRRLVLALAPAGEIVIGNFAEGNPSRPLMEIVLDWHLHHRTPRQLSTLAIGCGIPADAISVGAEPQGVNLFLHIGASRLRGGH